jgi:mono/diheme cytochrome c family protein
LFQILRHRFWHIAAFVALHKLGRYRNNSGHCGKELRDAGKTHWPSDIKPTRLHFVNAAKFRGITVHRIMLACTITAATLVALFPALAQTFGNPSSGRQIATKVCSSCHYVFATKQSKTEVPPSFEDIANLPSTTALSLKVFLRSNHKRMPNLILSDAEADDVIAYILSLKRR